MFTFDQIKELVELVGRHHLHALEIERAGYRLKITGDAPAPARETMLVASPAAASMVAAPPTASSVPVSAASSETEEPAIPPPADEAADLHRVSSPIVGTFYAAPSPDTDAFVRVGDRVRKGQVLCIVEAMKLMNEIESDVNGVVAEVYPKNAQPVEYGEALFGIRLD